MRSALLVVCSVLLACSKKEPESAPAPSASAGPASTWTPPKPAMINPCPASFEGELTKCEGALNSKLDKYVWKVTAAGKYEVTLVQPDKERGFRPVLIVWKEPEETLKQDDVSQFGADARVEISLQPGDYRVSVINGSKGELAKAFPYALAVKKL